jgi:alpha-amylase
VSSLVSFPTAAQNANSPAVYQGQEQHFKGNGTPFNREPLWTSKYDKTAPLYTLTSTLNKARNNAIKLSPEYLSRTSETLWVDVNHLCLKKGPAGSQIVFCVNNKSSKGDSYQASIGGFRPNEKVVELVGCKTSTTSASGNVTMYMGNGEPKVYVLASSLNGTGLCPQTTEDAPVAKKNGAGVLGVTGSIFIAAAMGWAAVLLA